jgi:hypothetical protein
MKTLPGLLSRRFEYSIEGLARAQEIETVLGTPDFLAARNHDQKKRVLVHWLRTRRLQRGYAVAEIDRQYRAFSDQAAAAYASWDDRQAEEILRQAGKRRGR